MAFPSFSEKIEILQKKFKIDPGEIARVIGKDKTTAWRWLGRPLAQSEANQEALARAICTVLNRKHEGLNLDIGKFRIPNILNFCVEIGLSKFEAAIYTNQGLPVPDVFIDSVFQFVDANQRNSYLGPYLLFRDDKERTHAEAPYLQAYARIYNDDIGRLSYEDSWAGDGESQAQTYEGFVIFVGSTTNVVGQRQRLGPLDLTEVFWQGLRRKRDGAGLITHLYGYVSDVTVESRTIFADRMVLVRSTLEEVARVKEQKEYYVTAQRVRDIAGDTMLTFIDAWRDVPIGVPE